VVTMSMRRKRRREEFGLTLSPGSTGPLKLKKGEEEAVILRAVSLRWGWIVYGGGEGPGREPRLRDLLGGTAAGHSGRGPGMWLANCKDEEHLSLWRNRSKLRLRSHRSQRLGVIR
jgi:hypothetical protein